MTFIFLAATLWMFHRFGIDMTGGPMAVTFVFLILMACGLAKHLIGIIDDQRPTWLIVAARTMWRWL